MHTDHENAAYSDKSHFDRMPEAIVIGGYRNWLAGAFSREAHYWRRAFEIHVEILGNQSGKSAFEAMSALINQISVDTIIPLQFHNPDVDMLCRDECLLLAFISATQHGNETAQYLCTKLICDPSKSYEITAKAETYASILKDGGCLLAPVSIKAIRKLSEQSGDALYIQKTQVRH
ncbi:MAG: hypothetical protein AAF362_03085 [Pseudomonadota bacterium]